MIAYLDNKVHALYTNQNIITSKSKIKYGTPKQVVRQRLGQPITEMDKQRLRIAIKIVNMMSFIQIMCIQRYFMINMNKMV